MTTDDRSYWNRHARGYDWSLVPLGIPMPRMLRLTADAVAGAERVLEVAAGTGLVTPTLARAAKHVVATDYADAMVRILEQRVRANRLQNVTCEQADLYALRFEAGTFDAVVAANVLHLLPDVTLGIEALRRVLKPGGQLVVPTFCHAQSMLSRTVSRVLGATGFPGRRRFTLDTLAELLGGAGLQITRTELIPGLIPIGFVAGTFPNAS